MPASLAAGLHGHKLQMSNVCIHNGICSDCVSLEADMGRPFQRPVLRPGDPDQWVGRGPGPAI